MRFSKTALFYMIFFGFTIVIAVVISCILSNVLSLVYSENPQNIMMLNPEIMINRLLNEKAVNEMFWIILSMFFILIIATRFHRWFGLKDYKSKLYKVTDDIKIPQRVGNKQTQQGSSWWLSKKQYKKVFNVNTIDTENTTIQKLLYNADQETEAIKRITIPYKEVEGNIVVDEDNLKNEINKEYIKIENKQINEEEQKMFKKGGIVLGREERTKFSMSKKFPFIKTRKVEEIYYVGDNVHTLTVGATRSGKTRCLVIESIYNCGLAGESMIISDPKGELFEYTSGGLKQLGYNVLTLDFKKPMRSNCYNFLQPVINEIKKGNIAQAQQKASDICESLVEDTKQEKIWSNGEKATIKSAIMSVCMEAPIECQNIANVYYFLSNMCAEQKDGSMLMDKFLDNIKKGNGSYIEPESGEEILRKPNPNHPSIGAFAPAQVASSKTRQSFFSSALTTLVLFTDQYIAKMTSKTEIKAEDLANKKTVLYLILPDEKLTYYSLCSLFVNQIYQQLVNIADSGGGALRNRVNFILDEFGNFSPIPNFRRIFDSWWRKKDTI